MKIEPFCDANKLSYSLTTAFCTAFDTHFNEIKKRVFANEINEFEYMNFRCVNSFRKTMCNENALMSYK